MSATSTLPAPSLISITQASERAGVSRDTIRRRIADGSLPAVRLGPRLIRLGLDYGVGIYDTVCHEFRRGW